MTSAEQLISNHTPRIHVRSRVRFAPLRLLGRCIAQRLSAGWRCKPGTRMGTPQCSECFGDSNIRYQSRAATDDDAVRSEATVYYPVEMGMRETCRNIPQYGERIARIHLA